MTVTAITVTVNGAPRDVVAGTTVADLVGALSPGRDRGVAVALNDAVVPRAEWPRASLVDGDRVEVLTAVQGG